MANCIYKYKGKDYTKEEFYSLVSSSNFIQQEQAKKFAELQERLSNKEFIEGAKNAFESSEELQNVYYEAAGFEIPTTKLEGRKAVEGKLVNFDVIEELASAERSDIPSSILIKKLLNGGYLPKINETDIVLGGLEYGIWRPNLKKIEAQGGNKSTLAKKVGHELLHSVTHNIIYSYQNLKGVVDFNDKYNKDNIRQGYVKPTELTKSQIEALDNLVRIRNKVVAYIEQNKDKIQKQDRGFGTYDYFIRTNYTESETDLHEFISEVFTNPELINILKEIPSEGKKSNLFKDFVDAISKILGFNNTSILEDIIAYSEEAFFAQPQITPQQKQEALNAYTDYIARVSLGIIKNPSSGEYNYESQVKNIVHHGSLNKIETFDKNKLGSFTKAASAKEAIFFIDSIEVAKTYAVPKNLDETEKGRKLLEEFDINKITPEEDAKYGLIEMYKQRILDFNDDFDFDSVPFKKGLNKIKGWKTGTVYEYYSDVYSVLLNIKNPKIKDFESTPYREESFFEIQINAKQNNNDGTILKNTFDGRERWGVFESNIYTAFEPEQIHILGSKTDIEGFKEFVQEEKDDLKPFIDESNKVGDESINERLKKYEESIKIPNNVKSKVLEKIEKETEKVKEKLLSLGLKQEGNKFELITNSYATFRMKLKELENVNAIISTNKTSDFYQIIARLKNTDSTMELKKQGELPFTPIEVKQVIQEQQFLNDVADNVFEGLSEEEKQILKKKIENGDYDLNCRI